MDQLVFIGLFIFLFSAILQGLTGFGFSILAVPLITLFISPKIAVPILLIYSMIINIVVLYSARKSVDVKKIWILLVAGIITMPLGTHLLVIMNENLLKIFIGSMILIFGILLLIGFRKQFKNEKIAMIPVGMLSGILGGSISVSGPPIILFLSNQNVDKNTFRGNLAAYFFILNIFTIPVYYWNGLLTKTVWNYSLTFLPGLLIGVLVGNILSHKITDDHFKKIILILLIFMGALSIISGLK
ncbi:MAG: sulfite exporter TauE/SafE family protein [Candidatus Cloacimonetes bacterium]|nr:sulfite exporter TauE/SafE family protein [Candidatus Cloacimonadota bacterium]MBT4575728.1 sulfite exporter TauE/SafE family protein [Candidatus Cloacimonadota bacterium]